MVRGGDLELPPPFGQILSSPDRAPSIPAAVRPRAAATFGALQRGVVVCLGELPR